MCYAIPSWGIGWSNQFQVIFRLQKIAIRWMWRVKNRTHCQNPFKIIKFNTTFHFYSQISLLSSLQHGTWSLSTNLITRGNQNLNYLHGQIEILSFPTQMNTISFHLLFWFSYNWKNTFLFQWMPASEQRKYLLSVS